MTANKGSPLRALAAPVSRTIKASLDRSKALDGRPEHLSWEGYVFTIVIGLCMAFTTGYSNGVCLSGFLQTKAPFVAAPVAGVTNAITKSAINLLEGDMASYRLGVGTLMCSMAGSCIAAVMNPRPVPFILSPRYGPTFLIGSVFAALGAVAALSNGMLEFHFTAAGCGLMNGVTSMYSANLIRVSSYSGPITDIGIYIGQWLRGNRSNNWRLYTLSSLTLFFFIGALVGYEAAKVKRQYALIFNASFFFLIGVSVVLYFVVRTKLNLFEALFGIGKVGIRFRYISVKKKMNDSQGNHVQKSVHQEELLAIYDELIEKEGEASEDALMSLLASRDLQVKRYRRSIFGIVQEKLREHDGKGDWTVSRGDWEKLVAERDRELGDSFSPLAAPALGRTGVKKRASAVSDSIFAMQRASIIQFESTGWQAEILEWADENEK